MDKETVIKIIKQLQSDADEMEQHLYNDNDDCFTSGCNKGYYDALIAHIDILQEFIK